VPARASRVGLPARGVIRTESPSPSPCFGRGGIGILLPSLTRIQPRLTLLAALGCAALQVCAVVFHVSRGEAANTPFNSVLVGLSLFVFWGRRSKAPIAPRD